MGNKLYETAYYHRLLQVHFNYEHTENTPSIISKIHDLFSTTFNDDAYEIQKFNENGYGYLFPKILLYTKGYEAFLKEFSSVLTLYSDSIYFP